MHASFRSTGTLALLCLAVAGVAAPRLRAQPLEAVPLVNLSAFEAPGGARPDGWQIAGDAWTLWDSAALEVEAGTGVLVNAPEAGAAGPLATPWAHGDLVLELEYLLPRGAESGLYLQGRYEVQIADSWGVARPRAVDAAGISPRYDPKRPPGQETFEGHAPRVNAGRAPGLWQQLRVVFEAPRFDAVGRKTANARIVEVVHNGVVVQQSVQVTGPTHGAPFEDERATGPLVLEGGRGGVAFRNIRYRQFEPVASVTLTDVRYTLHRGEFGSVDEIGQAPAADAGEAFGFVWNLFGRAADRMGLVWNGTLHAPRAGEYAFTLGFNWIDAIPYDEDAVIGGGRLVVAGQEVVTHTGADSSASGRIFLEEGAHPFELTYFKNRRLWRPIVFFEVEGPGMPKQFLNAARTLPEPESSYPPVPVDPLRTPYVLRSFVDHQGELKTNVASVGDPSGVHYALDLDAGGLLYAWKGGFVDAGSMWTGRGELQQAVPRGQRITLSGRPTWARLPHPEAPWPLPAAHHAGFQGYVLDATAHPVFRYDTEGLDVVETLRPDETGKALRRQLTFAGSAAPDDLWVLVAEGRDVRQRAPGVYAVDGAYFVDLGAERFARVRVQDERRQLLVPVRFASGEARLAYDVVW